MGDTNVEPQEASTLKRKSKVVQKKEQERLKEQAIAKVQAENEGKVVTVEETKVESQKASTSRRKPNIEHPTESVVKEELIQPKRSARMKNDTIKIQPEKSNKKQNKVDLLEEPTIVEKVLENTPLKRLSRAKKDATTSSKPKEAKTQPE